MHSCNHLIKFRALLVFFVLPFVCLAQSPIAGAGTLRYNPENFNKILVEAEIGTIKIEGNGEGVIETSQGPLWKDSDCELYAELDDHVLKLKLDYKDGDSQRDHVGTCDASVIIKVPSAKDVEVKAGSSHISIIAMSGKSKVRLKKGDLIVHSDLTEMDVRGDSVKLISSGSIAKMKVEIDQSNFSLEMKKLGSSDLRRVGLDISDLKTEVVLPLRANVKVHFTGDGILARSKSDFAIPSEQDPLDFDLKINSDSGSVGVKKI